MRVWPICDGVRVVRVVGCLLGAAPAVLIGWAGASRAVPVTLGLPDTQRERSPSSAATLSSLAAPSCAEGLQIRLFFGLGTPDGTVSDEKWARFLTDVVTPRFPSGLTVLRADGQWRAPGRAEIASEPSRVVEIVADNATAIDRRVREVVAIYRQQYQQDSVMLTRGRLEVCF